MQIDFFIGITNSTWYFLKTKKSHPFIGMQNSSEHISFIILFADLKAYNNLSTDKIGHVPMCVCTNIFPNNFLLYD